MRLKEPLEGYEGLSDPDTGVFLIDAGPMSLHVPKEIRVVQRETASRLVYLEDQASSRTVSAAPELLPAFLALRDGSAKRIEKFARQWGPLRVCRHDHGLWAHGRCSPRPMPGTSEECLLVGNHDARGKSIPMYFWEPLETWRQIVRKAEALLEMGNALKMGVDVPPDRISTLDALGAVSRLWGVRTSRRERQRLFAFALNVWLREAGVRPVVLWNATGHLETPLGFDGVIGAVAAEVYSLVIGPKLRCHACGEFFKPLRHATRGVRVFCLKKECKLESVNAAGRDYRMRKSYAAHE